MGRWIREKRILDDCERRVVSEYKNEFPNKGPSEDSPAAFLRTFDVISLAADDNHDDRYIPVTFCHEFVRRLPLDRQG
jgi:hypothetical protein